MIDVLIALHILCGAVALLVMVVPFVTRKGSKNHVRAGRIYVIAMIAVVLLAWVTCGLRLVADPENGGARFLALVGLLAGHSTWQGWRAAARRDLGPSPLDAAVSGAVAVIAIGAVLALGRSALWISFGSLLVFTAGLGVRDGIRGHADNSARIRAHIVGVVPACIATVTAVLVVNLANLPPQIVGLLPPVLWWLLPTIAGVPAIVYYTRRV